MKVSSIIKASTLFVVALFVAFTMQSCDKPKVVTQAELEGFWVLKTLNGKEAKTVFAGAIPTLEFNFADSLVYGTSGCNRYTGPFSYKEGIFTAPNLAGTKMLCTEDNEEPQFLLALTNGDNILSIVNGVLTFTNGGKVTLEFEKGTPEVVDQPATPSSASLTGTWSLKNIAGVEASSKFGESIPSLVFDFANNRLSGNSGCNNFTASFTLVDGGKLATGAIMGTKMACPNLEGEAEFLQALSDTTLLTLPNENVLQIAKNGTVLLELEKQVAETK